MPNNKSSSIQSLEDVLTVFGSDWPNLVKDDCNPLDIALPLIEDGESFNFQNFQDLRKQFIVNLQRSVNENYMVFNDSIGSYGISIETLNQSQDRLTNIRKNLSSVNELVNSKSNILNELNNKRIEYLQTLEILDKTNQLQKKLNDLQEFIENQEFVKSVNLVKEIDELASDNGLFNIESLQSLQVKLNSYISVLFDGLLGKLNGYIYYKNFTSSSLSTTISNSTNNGDNRASTSNTNTNNNDNTNSLDFNSGLSLRKSINMGLFAFIKVINNEIIDENEEIEVQNGRFYELYERFKQIQKINKENECLTRLVDNCEKEIKQVIRRTISEVKSKYPTQIEINLSFDNKKKDDPFMNFNLLQGVNSLIIKEVFENIFKKLLLLLQRHIAIYEIFKLNGYKYKIDKVWREVQKQISLLIFNYIIDNNLLNNLDNLDSNYKKKNKNSPFDKIPKQFEQTGNNTVFEFSQLSINSISKDLIKSLNNIFGETSNNGGSEFNLQYKFDESIFIGSDDINESKRNILVIPNIFNMAYIIEPFINFTCNLTSIHDNLNDNAGGKEAVEFFNQFMDIVFISQLENTLLYQFDKLCENKWKVNSLLEASNLFKIFFNKVLILLDTSLYYRPSYVDIIFKLFYKLDSKFNEVKDILLKLSDSKLIKNWINDSKLKGISNNIVKSLLINDNNKNDELYQLQSTELTYSLSIVGEFIPNINPNSFLSIDNMRSLVDLLASLSNILSWLPNMKKGIPKTIINVDLRQELREIWSLSLFSDNEHQISNINLNFNEYIDNDNDDNEIINDNSNVISNNFEDNFENRGYLALNSEMNGKFNKIIENLQFLMNEVEILIRYEIRLECVWSIIQMMINKQWQIIGDESVDLEIDKFCERINNINRIFNKVSENIINKRKSEVKIRIFGGLGFWIDKLVIFESRRISVMGKNGWNKMIVNLRVLQQVIKNIDNEIDNSSNNINTEIIHNSIEYFTIGSMGEKFLSNFENLKLKNKQFSEEDWKNLIRLIFSERMQQDKVGNIKKKFMAAQSMLVDRL